MKFVVVSDFVDRMRPEEGREGREGEMGWDVGGLVCGGKVTRRVTF